MGHWYGLIVARLRRWGRPYTKRLRVIHMSGVRLVNEGGLVMAIQRDGVRQTLAEIDRPI